MTRAAHRRLASPLEGLERTDLVTPIVVLAVAGLDQLLEHVVQSFVSEIGLFLGDALGAFKINMPFIIERLKI
jgi:hypothetical protein